MKKYDWAALNYLETASDEEWMCFAWFYLDHYHVCLALYMVNQRRCPEAVALALYWYSHPSVCLKYREERMICEYHSTQYAIFETVERYCGTGFYKVSDIGFNPAYDINDPIASTGLPRNWINSLVGLESLITLQVQIAVPGEIIEARKIAFEWIEGLPPRLAELVFDSS